MIVTEQKQFTQGSYFDLRADVFGLFGGACVVSAWVSSYLYAKPLAYSAGAFGMSQ